MFYSNSKGGTDGQVRVRVRERENNIHRPSNPDDGEMGECDAREASGGQIGKCVSSRSLLAVRDAANVAHLLHLLVVAFLVVTKCLLGRIPTNIFCGMKDVRLAESAWPDANVGTVFKNGNLGTRK
jgi:hypothetical protein